MYNTILGKRIVRLFSYLLCVTAFIFITSCTQNAPEEGGGAVFSTGTKEFNAVIDKATAIIDSTNPKAGLTYLDSCYRRINPGNINDRFHYYAYRYNVAYRDIKDLKMASRYCDTMMQIAEKYKNDPRMAIDLPSAYFAKGDLEFKSGNYDESYKNYYLGQTLAKNKVNNCVLSDYNYRLGMVLYSQERYEDAADNFKTAFSESAECGVIFTRFYRRQEVLDNIGLCYSNLGEFDSALYYYNYALAFIDSYATTFANTRITTYDPARAIVYGNMASVYVKLDSLELAKELLVKSIAINILPHNELMDAQLSRLKLADIFMKEKDAMNTKVILQQVKSTLDSVPNEKVKLGWYKMMWRYYDLTKDGQAAYNYLELYKNYDDSLEVSTKRLRETDMGDKIKNLDKQYQIDLLQKNNRLKQTYLIIAVLLVLLSITTMLFIYQNWKRSRHNVDKLSELNGEVNQQKEKLEQILAELEASNRDKDRILSAVAHDVRNPIASITSLSELLLAENNSYTPEQLQLIEYIKSACNDALTITKDILTASQPRAGEKITLQKTDINILLHECIDILRFRANEKHQQIVLKLATDMPPMLINKERIWRVVSNLAINAIKFSPDGATIDVIAQKINDHLHISVHDNGIGIPDKLKDRIFEMFTEAKRAGTAGEKPFGLGLAISRRIVEEHDGKIWFESTAAGTTFHVTLPIYTGEA